MLLPSGPDMVHGMTPYKADFHRLTGLISISQFQGDCNTLFRQKQLVFERSMGIACLECVSKREIRKFEWILRQFKE